MKISIASANLAAIDAGSPVPPQQLPAGWDTEFRFFADRDLPPRAEVISPRLQSKLPKMCGFEWFKDADLIGWLDCAYTVTTPGLAAWLVEQLGDADICLMRHPDRTSVSEEIAFMAQRMQQGDDYLISRYAGEPMAEQVQSYLSDPGFHDGWLAAAGCFVYRNTPTVRAAMKDWLIECIRWSSQDQLSLPYVLQRHGIEPRWMDASIWQSPHLRYDGHRATAGSGSPAPSAGSRSVSRRRCRSCSTSKPAPPISSGSTTPSTCAIRRRPFPGSSQRPQRGSVAACASVGRSLTAGRGFAS